MHCRRYLSQHIEMHVRFIYFAPHHDVEREREMDLSYPTLEEEKERKKAT